MTATIVAERIKLKIEQDHIDQGCRYSGMFCGAALAFAPHLSDGERASVGQELSVINDRDEIIRQYAMPQSLKHWVVTFDIAGAKGVQPGEFELQRIV